MAITAVVAAVAVGAGSSAIQAKQQKIAAQKQKDVMADAQANQQKLLDEQKKADAELKARTAAATEAAFSKVAASRSSVATGASIPGAVAEQPIGSVGSAAPAAAKKLIGS